MSAQLRRIAVLEFYVSWLVSLTLLTLLRQPMGWALASWVTGDKLAPVITRSSLPWERYCTPARSPQSPTR
jgi:hypothetical protein